MNHKNNKKELNTGKEDLGEDFKKHLQNKSLGTNIFDHLKSIIQEERRRNQQAYEELSIVIEKTQKDYSQQIHTINENTETNFTEFRCFLENLNRNVKKLNEDMSYFKEDLQIFKNEIIQLKKKDEENIEMTKTLTKEFFNKIKNMLNIINERIENLKAEFNSYKEANEVEVKKKNVEIIRLINDETETLNKKREEGINAINSNIKQLKDFLLNFQKSIEQKVTEIEEKIEIKKKETDQQINELSNVQHKMIKDIYSSFENLNT